MSGVHPLIRDQKPKATVYDVAKVAGVSPGTVSRVINNRGYIKEETRNRIISAIEKMDYIPNQRGRALKTTRVGLILLAIPDMSNGIYIGMIEAVNKIAKVHNSSMVLYYTEGTLKGELKAVRMLEENFVDGLFLVHFSYSHLLYEEIQRCHAPITLCGMCNHPWANQKDNNFDTISIDVYRGIYDSTAHLIGQGHKKIGYLAGVKGIVVYQQRYEAFRQSLLDHNLFFDEKLVFWRDYYEESGYIAARSVFLMDNRPTAICASNDLQAIGFWKACKKYDMRIPKDLAICGMDNLSISEIISLTSLKMYEYEVGEIGAGLLFKRLEKEFDGKPKNIIFTPSLMIRQSSISK